MEAIDPTALTMLREQIGDDDCAAVVDLFIGAAPQRSDELREGDATTVARVAHTLGSTARLLGAGRLAATAARVQAAARAGATPDGREELVVELSDAVTALAGWRATAP